MLTLDYMVFHRRSSLFWHCRLLPQGIQKEGYLIWVFLARPFFNRFGRALFKKQPSLVKHSSKESHATMEGTPFLVHGIIGV
jgi:hypothetical protein